MNIVVTNRGFIRKLSALILVLGALTLLPVPNAQALSFSASTSAAMNMDFWRNLYRAPTWQMNKGPNHTDKVVLTYDDCPNSIHEFRRFVDAAERLQITTVFFPIAWCGNTFDASYARARGQLVAGHSNTHPHLTSLTPDQIRNEIDVYSRQSGVMRPPHGSRNTTVDQVLNANGIRQWHWSLYTTDWTLEPSTKTIDTIVSNARPGDTVLLHMNAHTFNEASLTEIKHRLQTQRGLNLCHIQAGRNVNAQGTHIPNGIACG